jgi:hypothetical protein
MAVKFLCEKGWRVRTSFRSFRVVLVTGLAIALPANAAVWDDYPTLICRGDKAVSCSLTEANCFPRETTAVWKIDFRKSTVAYLGGKLSEAILAKHVTMFGAKQLGQRIFLDSGRVLSFHKGRDDAATGYMISATLVGDELIDGVEASTFQCSPNL